MSDEMARRSMRAYDEGRTRPLDEVISDLRAKVTRQAIVRPLTRSQQIMLRRMSDATIDRILGKKQEQEG